MPNNHYYLQLAVTPDWKGSVALCEHISVFVNGGETL
jgi:hypothetical protein